jgi:hypothetical protein
MDNIAKEGSLLCVDSREYSSYGVTGFFVVLRDFDPMAELATYLAEHADQAIEYRFRQAEFLATLLGKGFLLEIVYGSLYLGDYENHAEISFTPTQSEDK